MITGPKIVQKYLHDPVCFERPEIGQVKFDIRYIILLRSTKPLKVYAYNRFWLRFANQKFEVSLYNFCMLFSLYIFVFLKMSHWCWFLTLIRYLSWVSGFSSIFRQQTLVALSPRLVCLFVCSSVMFLIWIALLFCLVMQLHILVSNFLLLRLRLLYCKSL